MIQYLVRRLIGGLGVLLMVTVCVFFAVRLAPGDLCGTILGVAPENPGQCDAIDKQLGLDQPPVVQYVRYIGGIANGDFGRSFYRKTAVTTELKERLPLTLEIATLATGLAIAAGIPLGVLSAVRQNRPSDYATRVATIMAISMPSFWVATFAIVLPALWWGYAPPAGYVDIWDNPSINLEQLILPSAAAGLYTAAAVARMTRSSMVEVMRQDYMRTARAKGLLGRTVILRHALRNALLPLVTMVSFQFALLLGGTAVLESIFALPGMGSLAVQAVQEKDYPVVQGIVVVSAVVVILVNICVDFSYALLDPRIRTTAR